MTDNPTGKDYVGSDDLYADVQRTMKLCAEMNTGYHNEAEIREYLRQITCSNIDDTVRVFTPLNINYGPGVRFGDDCFLNFGCTLLAIGGITIGDGAFIGPHCVLATEYHPEDPPRATRCLPSPSSSAVTLGWALTSRCWRVSPSARTPSSPPEAWSTRTCPPTWWWPEAPPESYGPSTHKSSRQY